MNIFALDDSPINSARWLHDRHVVKMIVESCQLLSTACKVDGAIIDSYENARIPWGNRLYKVTHANHPSAVWARESKHNFVWLTLHLSELLREYHRRFPGRRHKCDDLRITFAAFAGHLIRSGFYTSSKGGPLEHSFAAIQFANGHTPFVYCGPDIYSAGPRVSDANKSIAAEDSYRRYYVNAKCKGNRWTQRNPVRADALPDWLKPHATIHYPGEVQGRTRGKLLNNPPAKPIVHANPSAVKMPRFGGMAAMGMVLKSNSDN